MIDCVTKAHQDAVEVIRAHLVHLRGGAPFLSPADSSLLIGWLESGIPMYQILASLEFAAEKRHQARKRTPLSLRHARPHLSKRMTNRTSPLLAAEPMTTAHAQLATAVRHAPCASICPHESAGCAQTLESLGDKPTEEALAQALTAIAAWLDAVWGALTPDTRASWYSEATHLLEDILPGLDEARAQVLLEEYARSCLRASIPGISVNHIHRAFHP